MTAYHPEANGIAEAKVKALKLLLRSLVKSEHKQRNKFLPFAILLSTHPLIIKQDLLLLY